MIAAATSYDAESLISATVAIAPVLLVLRVFSIVRWRRRRAQMGADA